MDGLNLPNDFLREQYHLSEQEREREREREKERERE
jgi:hypothetical protein